MIKINKDTQIIKATLIIGSEQLNKDGECGHYDYNTIFHESEIFKNVDKLNEWLNCHGVAIGDFKRFDSLEESNRLSFAQEEKENGLNFYVDYDLYINIYNIDDSKDYLKLFEEF